ncbi:MAG: transcriptional regulator [Chloroflexi bacterium]|nr:transcriptional regulator [Chloroflexota bacterium]
MGAKLGAVATTAGQDGLQGLPSGRQAVLRALKQGGALTTEEVAGALTITVSGARQHRQSLERGGLVSHHLQRGLPGRPKFQYILTARGEALFPRRYGDLASELLEYVEQLDQPLVEQLFDRRRQRRLNQAMERLREKSFGDQVRELARVLDEDGYLASFTDNGDGTYRITEHNCAILDVARRWGHACSSELQFLRQALPDADVRRAAHMLAGAHVCAYEISPAATGG